MKGADMVMAGIVQYNDWLEEEVTICLRKQRKEMLLIGDPQVFISIPSVETWQGKVCGSSSSLRSH